ncbi:hypothetical protein [Vibrio agarivorans]|uniref:hypothetical protein n=1 Tax=Vibrio agarivorans TaxID=153622 RepID=UPI0025B3BB12|nr:hypothetical protein [Vibrio agarivorans]MDN3661052.1 hypothetical protein [Vibrio agarivorans]
MSETAAPFVSRDEINFFHYIGETYPEVNIVSSEGRVFASLFRNNKSYVVLKSADMEKLTDIQTVSVELFRKGVMLFLKINFYPRDSDKPIFSILPIDAKLDDVAFPKYPAEGELMQFEVHLLDYFNGDKLGKVIRFHVEALDFQEQLVELYKHQKGATYERNIALLDTKAFLSTSFTNLYDSLVMTSAASIDKQTPSEFEQPRLDYSDELNAVSAVVA